MRHNPKRVLSHTTWFFDLDNTLHNANVFFPEISEKMNRYLAKHVLGDETNLLAANTLRLSYWRKYGATATGVLKNHSIDLLDFFEKTHDFPDLKRQVQKERGLANLLKKLPGKKFLLTNAPFIFAKALIDALNLSFSEIISFETMKTNGFCTPKPSYRLFQKLAAHHKNAILIEDSPKALKSAKKAGMKTIWITRYAKTATIVGNATPFSFSSTLGKRASYMDAKISSLHQLIRVFKKDSL